MQQKYTAADVREKRISFEGLTEEQFLALQAHFHKSYPEDGYASEEYVSGYHHYHRFYPTKDPEDGVSGSQSCSYLMESCEGFQATLEITYDEFEFGQFVVGEIYVGEWLSGGVKKRVIFKPTSSDNSTGCYFINSVNDFKKNLCCQGGDITFRKATDEEAQQLSNLIAKLTVDKPHTYGGEIADFPIEVVEKMFEYQGAQGNKRDVSVFERLITADSSGQGFDWANTPEGHSFWRKVLLAKNFDLFFETYPKEVKPNETNIPSLWSLDVTADNIEEVKKWMGSKANDFCLGTWSCVHFDKHACDIHNRPPEYVMISTEQFRKHVLGEEQPSDFETIEKLQNFITSPRNKPKPKATFHFDECIVAKSILLEAEELINGERAKDYGKVSDNFANIAVGWNVIAKGGIDARKVGHMMAWVKICRDLQNPKHDNLVDAAGYMGCIDKMSRE